MRPTTRTVGAQDVSTAIELDYLQAPFAVGFGVVVNGGGTLTFKVQHTFDDVQDSTVTPTWFDHSSVTGKTSNTDGNYAFPVRAIRLNVTAWTSQSATITVLQGAAS